jgi:hypothetical protein
MNQPKHVSEADLKILTNFDKLLLALFINCDVLNYDFLDWGG